VATWSKTLAALVLIAGAGCGGASLRDGVYADGAVRYRIGALPAGFAPVEVDDNDLAFYAPGAGTISVNSTCTDYEDVPLSALVNHLLFETTERRFLLEEVVTLDGRAARHVVVQAELDGVPLELELYVMKKNGCVFDLAHVRHPGVEPAARAAFTGFVARFALLEVHRDA
jgi:hypothetical protein